jgi:hypothetical protein
MRQRITPRFALQVAGLCLLTAVGMVSVASAGTCNSNYCTLDLNSTIYVMNNGWGSGSSPAGWSESITTNSSTAWRTDFNWPTGSNNNSVKAYPAAILGWHWGWHFSQAATGLPRQLSSSYSATSNYSYSANFGSGGVGNVSYDIWLTTDSNPGSSTQPTDEVMIWVNATGGAGPCGSVAVSNISLNGATWNLSQCQIPSYQYVWSFVRTSNSSSGTIDVKTFLDYLRNSRGLSSSKYLAGIEFGTEIFHGQGNVNVTNYTCSVAGSGGGGGGTGIVANGTYRVIARHSGKALDVNGHGTADGSNVIQWTYGGGNNQRWTLNHLGNNVYQITGVESGKALEVASTSTANGTNVDIRTYSGASNQRWTISATSGGYYRLTPVSSSGSALDVNGASTADGANVQQWSWTGGNNQQWTFQTP